MIGKVDCTQYKSICNDFEVKGYPTLLWIQDGKKVAKYSGDRSDQDLKRFVMDQLGSQAEEQPKEEDQGSVVPLTSDNFDNAIEKGYTFIKVQLKKYKNFFSLLYFSLVLCSMVWSL